MPPPSNEPSTERLALAEAIEVARAADAQQATLKQASADMAQRVYRLQDAVEAARSSLEQAKSDQAAHMVAVAAGKPGEPPQTIRAARSALTDVEDELSTAEAARDTLRAQLADVEKYPEIRADRVRRAALAVIAAEAKDRASALVDAVERMQAEIIRRGEELRWLAREAKAFPLGERIGIDFNQVVDARVTSVLGRIEGLTRTWSNVGADQQLGRALWSDALVALMADATAPLPD